MFLLVYQKKEDPLFFGGVRSADTLDWLTSQDIMTPVRP